MMRPHLACTAFLLCCASLHGQSFDIEQFEQIFRPRIKLDARYQPQTAFRDTSDNFSNTEGSAVFTFPIHSRFEAALRVDTNARNLDELVKNSLHVKASQLLGSARFGARQVELGFDSVPTRQLYSASIGMMGLKLTKKYRVLFWNANVNLSEEDGTLDGAVPRFSGTIGQMHMKGLRRNFFYGLAIAVSDKFTLPLPFIGGIAPIGHDWSFQYVLPAQLAMGFSPKARTKFMAGFAVDGFRSGMQWHDDRANVNYGSVRAFLNVRLKASKHLQIRADVGYAFAHTVGFSGTEVEPARYPIDPGLTCGVGVNVLFGGSVLDRILEDVLK